MAQIQFNGKTYNDIAEMPAMERQAYEQLLSMFKDENQDGVPDIFQGDVIGNLLKAATTTVIVDGKQVSGLGDMTPEQRAKLEQGMAKLKELGVISQIPDLSSSTQAPSWNDAEIRPSKPILQSPSVIQEDTGPRWGWVIAFVVAFGICILGIAALVIFWRGL